MIHPENFEEKTNFNIIRNWLKELCLGKPGQDAVDEMLFHTDFELIKLTLNRVHEFKQVCLLEDHFPVNHYNDFGDAFKKIKAEGTYLDEMEIFNLGKTLETIRAVLNFFRTREQKYPFLFELSNTVAVYPYIIDRVNEIFTKNAAIKDNASQGLKEVRSGIKSKENEVSKRIHQIFKLAHSSGWTDEDASVVIRDGRQVIPVSASNKRMIKGYIHDESSTGKTVYVEPTEIMELNNEIRELYYEERREIIKILIAFTSDIRPYKDEILYSTAFLKEIDFLRAKALFAIKVPSVRPVLENEPIIEWQGAMHPVLFLNHKNENKTVVPLEIQLNKQQRLLVISGPNAGGKSVCLKTAGLVQYMLQCGMLVPLGEGSTAGVFQKIFIDIGDEQSIENDLSTYSSHLLNMKFFIKNADENSLLLIDEFGSGTEPNIGGAMAEAMLQRFNELKSFGVVTTHYSNLKHFASSAEGVVNGAMLYDTQKMKPLFKLSIGGPGSSFAFEIARSTGIPEDILENASQKTGSKHVEFDKHLREILREKRYWERKRVNIRKVEKQLEQKLEKYNSLIENINLERKSSIQKSKKEAEEIISSLNRKIENTIRIIRESNADKEKTKEARDELSAYTKKVKQVFEKEDENTRQNKKNGNTEKPGSIEKDKSIGLETGSKVKIKGQDVPGEVLEINDKSVMVAFGNMVTTLQADKIEIISESEYKNQTKHLNPGKSGIGETYNKKINFKPDIDLRGKRAEEALTELNVFLDNAMIARATSLRILHGKGNGILKQIIREYLSTQDFILSARDEHVDFGGAGITIVELNY